MGKCDKQIKKKRRAEYSRAKKKPNGNPSGRKKGARARAQAERRKKLNVAKAQAARSKVLVRAEDLFS